MTTEVQERLLCAAIHFDDGKKHELQPPNIETGIVICGWRHPNCFAIYRALCPNRSHAKQRVEAGLVEMQGFLTSTGRFVDRMTAAQIARDANQIEYMKRLRSLMSEDLY